MDKPKGSGSQNKPNNSSNTLPRKNKRRNRKKRPKTVENPPEIKNIPTDLKSATEAVVVTEVPTNDTKPSPVVTLVEEKVKQEPDKMDSTKDRDQVKTEREAKRLAKKAKKTTSEESKPVPEMKKAPPPAPEPVVKSPVKAEPAQPAEKSREEIMKEREARKAEKLAAKSKSKSKPEAQPAKDVQKEPAKQPPQISKSATDTEISEKLENLHISDKNTEKTKPVLSKAERRAIQEAQRAAKAKVQAEKEVAANKSIKKPAAPAKTETPLKTVAKSVAKKSPTEPKKQVLHRVKLFNHLYIDKKSTEELLNEMADENIHPAIIQLGVQQSKSSVIGSNSRCIAFLNALKSVINDFVPPPQKIFSRSLESVIQTGIIYLQKCRPISVSMSNALKFVKWQINHLPDNETDEELKSTLCESIDTYIRDQIEKAALAISHKVQEKISNGDVILTFGCSSLIKHILDEACRRKVDFRVIVVDARPLHEGQEMLRRLVAEGINCTCVLINAVPFIMPEVTKVLLGAHALLANGYVMSRTGTAQVAMVAKSYNVPVLVCCETHKFSERVQTDAFVYNEIGNPNDLVLEKLPLNNWESNPYLTPLNLYYDITPPELVAAVITELAILPCTSVPVILRIKPTEMWF